MHIREVFINLIHNAMQIGAAVIITLLQRWLLELSTVEKDLCWLKRQSFYWWFARARWYRGMEVYHQYKAIRLLGTV
jgi:hypothetical protein